MSLSGLAAVIILTQAGEGASHKVDLAGIYECVFCAKIVQKVSELYFNTPNLRDVRHCLLFGFEGNLLNDE